jgi:hypothetical protein
VTRFVAVQDSESDVVADHVLGRGLGIRKAAQQRRLTADVRSFVPWRHCCLTPTMVSWDDRVLGLDSSHDVPPGSDPRQEGGRLTRFVRAEIEQWVPYLLHASSTRR